MSGPECSNGLPGFEGENSAGIACCPLQCTKCGGASCGSVGASAGLDNTDCCVNGVLNNQDLCSVTGAAPCVVDDDGGEWLQTRVVFEILAAEVRGTLCALLCIYLLHLCMEVRSRAATIYIVV